MRIKIVISLIVCLFIGCFSFQTVYADSTEDKYKCIALVKHIEESLGDKEASISYELSQTVSRLESLKSYDSISTDELEIAKINELIDTTKMLMDEYDLFVKRGNQFSKEENIYVIAAAAIMAWFNNQGYYLAEELLTHAVANTSYYSLYSPIYGSRVNYSSVFTNIKYNNTNASGSDVFPSSSNTVLNDLYYGIHNFDWLRVYSNTIRIEDLYDFTIDYSYWGTIQGYAVALMVAAQYTGAIVPFYTIIVQ